MGGKPSLRAKLVSHDRVEFASLSAGCCARMSSQDTSSHSPSLLGSQLSLHISHVGIRLPANINLAGTGAILSRVLHLLKCSLLVLEHAEGPILLCVAHIGRHGWHVSDDIVDLLGYGHIVMNDFHLGLQSENLSPLNFIFKELRVACVDNVEKVLPVNGLATDISQVREELHDLWALPDLSKDVLD